MPGLGLDLVRSEFTRASSKLAQLPISPLQFYCSRLGARLHLDQRDTQILAALVRASVSEPVAALLACSDNSEGEV